MSLEPFREPLRITLLRNGTIAIVVGAALKRFWGGLASWPLATLLILWPSLGGHWLEVWFLTWLRPRIAATRNVLVLTRIAVWFGGRIALALGIVSQPWLYLTPGECIGPHGGLQASPLSV
jgi:hypothetical protein